MRNLLSRVVLILCLAAPSVYAGNVAVTGQITSITGWRYVQVGSIVKLDAPLTNPAECQLGDGYSIVTNAESERMNALVLEAKQTSVSITLLIDDAECAGRSSRFYNRYPTRIPADAILYPKVNAVIFE